MFVLEKLKELYEIMILRKIINFFQCQISANISGGRRIPASKVCLNPCSLSGLQIRYEQNKKRTNQKMYTKKDIQEGFLECIANDDLRYILFYICA